MQSTATAVADRVTFKALDAFRGFAALWVVMYHGSIEAIPLHFPQLRTNLLYAFSLDGMLGVQIFFVVSGFCIANAADSSARQQQSVFKFAVARIRRIYPPYFSSLLLTALLSLMAIWLVSHHWLHSSTMAKGSVLHHTALWYFSQLSLTQVPLRQDPLMIVFWTLCYEVAFYLIVGIALWITRRFNLNRGQMLNSLHWITILSMGLMALAPTYTIFPFNMWPQFGLGILVFHWISRPAAKPWFAALTTLIAILFFAFRFNYGGDLYHVGSRGTFSVAAIFAVVLVLLHPFDDCVAQIRPVKFLAWIGTFSYSLYLTHMLPMGVVMQLGRPLLRSPDRFGLLFVLEIVGALAAAYPFFWLFERPFLSKKAVARVDSEQLVPEAVLS